MSIANSESRTNRSPFFVTLGLNAASKWETVFGQVSTKWALRTGRRSLKTDLEEKLIKGVVILKVQVFLEG